MTADTGNMTPISQHSFSLATVSYIGPAYTEQHSSQPSQAPVLRPVDLRTERSRAELNHPASIDGFVAVADAA